MRGGPLKNPNFGFSYMYHKYFIARMAEPEVLGVSLPQFLADQLTLFQPGGSDYAHPITAGTPKFFNPPPSLSVHDLTKVI